MNPTEPIPWELVEPVLDRLLELDLSARAAAIPRLCGDNAMLRKEVEAFLDAHDRAGEFLETSATAFAALHRVASEAADLAGARIGPYVLVRELGRGGMGRVWLAERADGQFGQRVALKLIKRGMDSDDILARFRRERQILARLDHPNIARLLDGGVSEDGRPWFAMEYVTGTTITEYCTQRNLGIEERLQRFAAVCRAVQYAHRNLVVHRDLKPSNVLVSESGEIKLLDFGVAKFLGDEPEDLLTAPGHAGRPMTPEYASPELVLGQPVTTASDVYQLGILVFELLTSQRPYRIANRSAREIERSICESQPYTPSTTVAGSTRKRLRGDLDAIALRALRKEPDQRYPSAEALAEDVERHLANLPLRFGKGTFRYGAAKFLRRHRGRVAIAAGLSLGVLGLVTSYTMRIRQERDRALQGEAKASESAALIRRFFQGWSPDAADRGDLDAAHMLSAAAERAQAELAGDPATLASTLSMLGDLQTALGRSETADSLLERALAIQQRLPAGSPADLAATLARRGRLYISTSRFRESEEPLRRALATYLSVMPADRTEVILVQSDLAESLWQQDQLTEAEAVLRDGLAKSASPDAPITTELGSQLGYVLFHQGRHDEAVDMLRPVLGRQRRIFGPVHRSTVLTLRYLSSALRDLGALGEAESLARDALRGMESLYGSMHQETAAARMALALVLERAGRFAEAEPEARHGARISERLVRMTSTTALYLRTVAAIRMAQGDTREAESLLRRALVGLRRTFPTGHPDEGDVLNRLAWVTLMRQTADRDSLYQQAKEFEASRSASGPWFVTDGYEYLGETARLRGDSLLAARMFRRAVELFQRQLPAGHPYRVLAESGLRTVSP